MALCVISFSCQSSANDSLNLWPWLPPSCPWHKQYSQQGIAANIQTRNTWHEIRTTTHTIQSYHTTSQIGWSGSEPVPWKTWTFKFEEKSWSGTMPQTSGSPVKTNCSPSNINAMLINLCFYRPAEVLMGNLWEPGVEGITCCCVFYICHRFDVALCTKHGVCLWKSLAAPRCTLSP